MNIQATPMSVVARPRSFVLGRRAGAFGAAIFVLTTAYGCGSPGSPTPVPPSTLTLNISGNWAGTGADSSGGGQVTLSLNQNGTSVTGTMQNVPLSGTTRFEAAN